MKTLRQTLAILFFSKFSQENISHFQDHCVMAHPDGDDGDDRCDYAPAACVEGDSNDDDGEYDYAPAASMEGDDDDDGGYDYEPAA
ncbi:hypothetical protein Acr_12g0008450 [Actinidia rufa]|uniref:Uncharacterized protein n=1 Tax=Actinidia rufa TaxID=165716 RepID=A0A7J0FHX7_9ERIC|nr:hypothetical protein Acr_12g0008450 [Actinidia rufa]